MRLLAAAVVWLSLCCLPLAAQAPARVTPSRGVGLVDLLRAALRDSPGLNSAEATRDAAHIDVVNAYIGLGPRANWVFDTSRERLDVIRSKNDVYKVGLSNFSNYANTLEVVQPLFDARLFAQLHGAYSGLHRSRAELDAVRQKTVFELIQAYLITLGSADALALSRAEQASLEKQNEMMEVRIGRGLANQGDADELTARLMQARAQTQAASATVLESFATLEHRAAVPVDALLPLAGPIAMPPPMPASVQEWVDTARGRNPEVIALGKAANEAFATFEAQGGAAQPRVELRFTQNRNESGGSVYGGGDLTADRTLLLRVTVPLFNGDGNGYPAVAAHARYQAAKYRIEDQRREVTDRVHTAYEEVVGNAAREKNLVHAAAAQARVVESRQQKFGLGLMRVTDVLDADRDLMQVRRQLLASRYNYLLNLMQLKRLAGDISDADVAFIDADLAHGGGVVRRPSAMPAAMPGQR